MPYAERNRSGPSEPETPLAISDSDETRLIYLDIAGRLHSLYNILIDHPPEGFSISSGSSRFDEASMLLAQNPVLLGLVEGPIARLVPANMLQAYLEQMKRPPESAVLTFSNGHIVFRSEPWLVDMEFVTQLAGYSYRHFVRFRH